MVETLIHFFRILLTQNQTDVKIILFDQWDKLIAMFKSMAGKAATEKSQYAINRVMPVEGRALLMDRAMNNISVSGESVTLQMPDIIPGKV